MIEDDVEEAWAEGTRRPQTDQHGQPKGGDSMLLLTAKLSR
jgi:hypothetical protein